MPNAADLTTGVIRPHVLTDSTLESYRRMLDAKIARLAREREQSLREAEVTRNLLNDVEQEQQNRLADNAWMERVREHRASQR